MRYSALISTVIPAFLACFAPAAAASDFKQRAETQFQSWLAGKVRADARKAGVSQAVFDRAVEGLSLDWSLPDLDIPGKPRRQHQAEFRSPGRYFSESQLAALTRTGRSLIRKHAKSLAAIERRYGVPREILVAIWGRESNFGRAKIPSDAVRTLATEAFVGTRKTFFYPEFIAALRMLEEGIPRSDLKSSWAGALGQPQFMPTNFLEYAVDFDRNGRRDIWRSTTDTLASIANFLRKSGWDANVGWGFEIKAPPDLACTLEGPHQGKSLREWKRLGAVRADGKPLGTDDADRTTFLLMPAGRLGPAFLVSQNFYVLKLYNESDVYALFVGHLGDRFRGPARIAGAWEAAAGFTRSDVAGMQRRLASEGRDVGGIDGLVGFRTRVAIGDWQVKNGRQPTCFPDRALIRRIVES